MNREGHLGLGMLCYAPIGTVMSMFGYPVLGLLGVPVVLFGAGLPDIDVKISVFKHRGWTHTIHGAFLIGIAVAGGIWLGGRTYISLIGAEQFVTITPAMVLLFGGVATFGVFSHMLGDLMTTEGIQPFDPLTPRGVLQPVTISERRISLRLFNAANTIPNMVALVLGVLSIIGFGYIAIQVFARKGEILRLLGT